MECGFLVFWSQIQAVVTIRMFTEIVQLEHAFERDLFEIEFFLAIVVIPVKQSYDSIR